MFRLVTPTVWQSTYATYPRLLRRDTKQTKGNIQSVLTSLDLQWHSNGCESCFHIPVNDVKHPFALIINGEKFFLDFSSLSTYTYIFLGF